MTFSSMWYWYEECILMNKELMKTKEIVAIYEDLTGIQAANEKAIRDAYEIKQAVCKDCVPALADAEAGLVKFKGRARRRGFTIAIAVPVVFGIGYGIGALAN
jgi:hypothetical protein